MGYLWTFYVGASCSCGDRLFRRLSSRSATFFLRSAFRGSPTHASSVRVVVPSPAASFCAHSAARGPRSRWRARRRRRRWPSKRGRRSSPSRRRRRPARAGTLRLVPRMRREDRRSTRATWCPSFSSASTSPRRSSCSRMSSRAPRRGTARPRSASTRTPRASRRPGTRWRGTSGTKSGSLQTTCARTPSRWMCRCCRRASASRRAARASPSTTPSSRRRTSSARASSSRRRSSSAEPRRSAPLSAPPAS